MTINKRSLRAGSIGLLFGLAVFFAHQLTLPTIGYYNDSPSEPKGFYLIQKNQPLTIGSYVILAVPEPVQELVYGRGWLRPGALLLKQVGALPGDRVTITDEGIYLNDRYFGPVYATDQRGLPVPQQRGSFIVPEGYFLPLTSYQRSFDGRYFGLVPIPHIQYQVTPLLTY